MADLEIRRDVSLQPLNTLALPARAEYFCAPRDDVDVAEALAFAREQNLAVTPLGGGSNVVLTGDVAGLVMQLGTRGIRLIGEQGDALTVRVAAGENWHELVRYSLGQGWFGLENLALIPGCAGAAPIQNIGAYGVELSEHFVSLEAMDIASGDTLAMDAAECRFGYRDSIFKQELRGRLVITAITLSLSRRPALRLAYPELARALDGVSDPTPATVSEAVCRLRQSKLPDPATTPNAGSFFKNPVVDESALAALRSRYPAMPFYPIPGGGKIPAAWLIEQAGWKGHALGPVGMHDRQALVLVNRGGAVGRDVLALAQRVAGDVAERFDIALEIEPRVLGDAAFRR